MHEGAAARFCCAAARRPCYGHRPFRPMRVRAETATSQRSRSDLRGEQTMLWFARGAGHGAPQACARMPRMPARAHAGRSAPQRAAAPRRPNKPYYGLPAGPAVATLPPRGGHTNHTMVCSRGPSVAARKRAVAPRRPNKPYSGLPAEARLRRRREHAQAVFGML